MESIHDNNDDLSDVKEDDTINILLATDIHLGYNEKDPIRGNDSFNTFEEILQHAVKNKVDFILLGGDLFHESKPSTPCYHRCISLLRKYCLGDNPVNIEFLSDPSKNFSHLKNPMVNYEDPNLNIGIPVFSIHGNHDDPTGVNNLSAMDILADTGLINYFGKWTDLTQVDIYPILLKKNETHLAIYGLSHIKDERLSRLFKDKKVRMTRSRHVQNWFNIFVLHQNRAQNRGGKNYIPECVLPNFLDLVVWGHEHDCNIDPERSGDSDGPFITQPGSSVATSLAFGESLPKYVGLLRINKTQFCLDKIKLNTVRPFIYKDINITKPDDCAPENLAEHARKEIEDKINEMFLEAETLKTTENKDMLPLFRLVVNFSDETMMTNPIRMGQKYTNQVANPIDMFSFKHKRVIKIRKHGDNKDLDDIQVEHVADNISDLVEQYFDLKNQTLNVLSTRGMCQAVLRVLDTNDIDAIDDIIDHQFKKTLKKLSEIDDVTEDNFQEHLEQLREGRQGRLDEERQEIDRLLNDSSTRKANRSAPQDVTILSSDDDDMTMPLNNGNSSTTRNRRGNASTSRPARGRGSRGSRRGKTRATTF